MRDARFNSCAVYNQNLRNKQKNINVNNFQKKCQKQPLSILSLSSFLPLLLSFINNIIIIIIIIVITIILDITIVIIVNFVMKTIVIIIIITVIKSSVTYCSKELIPGVENQVIYLSLIYILPHITANVGNTLILIALHKERLRFIDLP